MNRPMKPTVKTAKDNSNVDMDKDTDAALAMPRIVECKAFLHSCEVWSMISVGIKGVSEMENP